MNGEHFLWDYARYAAAALALVSAVFLAVLLFRGRPLSVHARWLLLIGCMLVPGFTLTVANTHGLEATKTVESCNSCHVMEPFVADMRDPKSEGLAAMHYQNRYILEHQCYTCHKTYEPFGTLEAKLKGLGHVVHMVRGSYELPIRHRGAYPVATCLHCHGESARFRKAETHADLDMSDVEACLLCHGRPHPIPESATFAAAQ